MALRLRLPVGDFVSWPDALFGASAMFFLTVVLVTFITKGKK